MMNSQSAEVSIAFRLNVRMRGSKAPEVEQVQVLCLNCLSAECSNESVRKFAHVYGRAIVSQLPFG